MARSRKLAIADAVIALVVLIAWLYMLFFGAGLLSSNGFDIFKFFTVDSNVLMGIVALVSAVLEWRGTVDGQPLWLRRLRLAATTAVMLTFVVVIVFLAPPVGFVKMYLGANLAFHLIVPLAATAVFVAFGLARPLRAIDALWGLVPLLAYAVFYVGRIVVMGPAADFYGFLSSTGDNIPVVVAIMAAATVAIGLALWKAGGGRRR